MEIVSCSAAEPKPPEAQGSQAAQRIPNSGCLLGFVSSTFSHPHSKVLPQFYTGASKSLRIKPARQEPAVSGVIFKHLTVHQTLKSCLAPSSIPALGSGRLRRRRSFPPGMVVMGFLRLLPGVTPATSSSRICSEHRAPAPHTHWGDRRCHRAPKGSWGRKGTNPRGHSSQTGPPPAARSRFPLSRFALSFPFPAGTETRRGRGSSGRPQNRSEASGRGGTAAARGPARGHPAEQQSPGRGFPGRHSPAGQPRGRGAPGRCPAARRAGPGRAPAGAAGDSRPRPGHRAEAAAGPR